MTQNKFWLVWNEAGNSPKKPHNTKEKAITEAKRLSAMYPQHAYVVLEATHSYKADVNVIETSFEATPLAVTEQDDIISVKPVLGLPTIDETETVEPKFKVGDRVLLDNYCDCIVEDYIDETKSYKVSIMGGGYAIVNDFRVSSRKYLTHA